MEMDKKRQESYIEELKRCAKADYDFYLEHNEANEFYNYICDLQKENKYLRERLNVYGLMGAESVDSE